MRRVFAFARRLAAAEAEDLVQEAYLRAYRTFDNFQPGTNSLAWLLTIVRSIYLNRRRRLRLEPQTQTDQDLESAAAHALEHVDWESIELSRATAGRWGAGEAVDAALARLPEAFRTAVVLVDLDGLSYEEASKILDCPVGTIRSRLARARRQLAKSLADYAESQGLMVARRAT